MGQDPRYSKLSSFPPRSFRRPSPAGSIRAESPVEIGSPRNIVAPPQGTCHAKRWATGERGDVAESQGAAWERAFRLVDEQGGSGKREHNATLQARADQGCSASNPEGRAKGGAVMLATTVMSSTGCQLSLGSSPVVCESSLGRAIFPVNASPIAPLISSELAVALCPFKKAD